MRSIVYCAVSMLIASAAAKAAVVADYQGNYTPTTFAPGWSYRWNPANVPLTTGTGQSVAANTANWVPLAFNSTGNAFETASTGAVPLAAPGSFLSAGPTAVHLGDTSTQAADHNSHYVILAYTFSAQQIASNGNNLTFHTSNFNVPADISLDPLDVEIFKNTQPVAPPFTFPAGTVFSDSIFGQDYPFGTVQPGDTLYIALGGTGNYSGQSIGVSYTLALTPEPRFLTLISLTTPLLLNRRRQQE